MLIPILTEYKEVQRYKPNFIFIDLDRNNFKTDKSFKIALSNTLKNIKEKLGNECISYRIIYWWRISYLSTHLLSNCFRKCNRI